MRRYLQLIQAGSGHGFISSRTAHPYRPAHSQECDGSLKTENWTEPYLLLCVRKNKVSFCARLWPNCQIQNPQGAGVLQWDRHRAAGLMSCWCLCSVMGASWLDTLISAKFSWPCVILQWSGKKTPSLWVWTSDVSYQDVWNKNHSDGHSEAADFHPGVYSTLLLCPW